MRRFPAVPFEIENPGQHTNGGDSGLVGRLLCRAHDNLGTADPNYPKKKYVVSYSF